MKSEKFLTTVAFRLLALVLCLTASIPQMQAAMYIVGDAPFGGWKTNQGMQMTQNGSSYTATATINGNIYFTFATQLCSGEQDWSTFNNYRLGAQQYNQNVTIGNTYFTQQGSGNSFLFNGNGNYVFTYNTSNNSFTITEQTYEYTFYVHLPNDGTPHLYLWNNGDYNGGWPGNVMTETMTLADGNTWYKFTGNFKVSTINAIVNLGQGKSQTADITNRAPGTHYITWNGNNGAYPEVSQTAPIPPTPHYYVTGDSGLGLGGFTCNPSLELTDSDNDGIYTCTTTATATGQYGFILANGKNNDWTIFNNNYRIGPTDGNENVTLNGSFQQTQLAGGDHGTYRVTVAAGSVTIHFNPTDMTFKVTGTAPPTYDYTFYVNLPNEGTPYLYLWDSNQNKLNGDWPGTAMSETEILDDGKTWYKFTGSYISQQINAIVDLGNNKNQSANINNLAPGTHYITWDGGNKTQASVSPTAPTPATIYINGDDILGGFSYQPSHTMTYTGDHIYTYTANLATKSTIQFVFGNGQGSNWDDYNNNYRIGPNNGSQTYNINSGYTSTQMAGGNNGSYKVTAGAGNVTFYFNNVTMQYKVEGTEPPVTYYVVGDDNTIFPNGWNMGDGTNMTYDSNDNNYSWTSDQVQLTAGTNYEYKVLGDDGSWSPGEGQPNASFSVTVSGTYTVKITRNSDGTVSHTLTLIDAVPLYIEGSEGLGLQWGYAPTTAMTYDTETGYYTYTYTVEHDGTYNFMFGNGQGTSWDDFNANYRIGPQSGDQAIALDDQWVSTQMARTDGGSYQINVAAGPVTIYFDPATMQFKVSATAPTYLYTFYIYPSDGATVPHIYLWDNAQNPYTNAFPGNEVTVTEELVDGKTWYKYSETILVDVLNAIISAGGSNADNTKTKDITNFEPGTYYIVWDPVRHNGEEYNHFELYNDPPTAVGEHQLFIHGGYYHEGQTYNYASDSGSEMKYYRNPNNPSEEYYYINNITLSSNATFCFSTQLGNDWQNAGVRYGNGGPEYTDNPNGTEYLEVTESKINTLMPLGPWSETYGEYKMFTAGVYNILASPSGGWVKLIKTDHKNLSPMNVYLEQTSNVEISNIQEPGTTYTTAMFDGYWPLSAYNQEQGGWDPYSDSQHYPVTYIGDTTTVDGKHWWHWQVSASIAEVFFSRTNKDPKQSEAIVRHAGVLWVTWDEINGQTVMTDHSREYFEAAANALPTNAVVMEGHYYVYFINTLGWDRVFCYAWDDADGQYTDGYNRVMESWPGHVCELVGIDPVTGYEVWRYDLGTISSIDHAPDGILFNDGDTNALSDSKEQTGDFEYINGGVYDYLGLFDGAYTLNNLIRTAAKEVRYTVSNDLLAVYYDPKAVTRIDYKNAYEEDVHEYITGALYAKDLNQYGEKSIMPDASYTDYVYQTCASNHTSGRSQIMIKRTTYDQSNWVKLVMSPNYDNRHEVVAPGDRPNLEDYVGHLIPAGTLDVFMTDTINPTAHVLAIQKGDVMNYEPNVYISSHFNDTVVFNYTHKDWQLGTYNGNYRTQPHIDWNYTYDEQGVITGVTGGSVERELVETDPYYMYYVAPKPQEIAYITWMVYDNYNTPRSGEDPAIWPNYDPNSYQPYTSPNPSSIPPIDPGRFYAPMNWNRNIEISGDAYESLQYLAGDELDKSLGAWTSDYGPYSNGYMQYGAIKVNWSLFQEDTPWWHIFKPGQAYKFLAIIRYARGSGYNPDPESGDIDDTANNYYYGPSIGNYEEDEEHKYSDGNTVFNAPRREDDGISGYANMYHASYRDLDESKFIIFPIKASAQRSNGDGMGNVTSVEEVISNVASSRTVVGVSYYNLMGAKSDKPFDGINIVVTTYSDGSRSSRKILR
jgi:hypothetical protein